MNYATGLQLAVANLRAHKLRSFLTMLGMIFGVGAVIAMLSIGAGAERESLRLIDTMGLRNIIAKDREFKDEDLKKVRESSLGLSTRDIQAISAVTPDIESYAAKKRVKTFQIFSFKGKSDDSFVVGVTPSYFRLAKHKLAEGSFFAEPDERDFEQFCVIGSRVKQKLFGYLSPIGQPIKFDKMWFTVIGVFEDSNLAKDEFEGVKIQDFSNDIYIPLATALKKFELKRMESELDEIVVSMKSPEALKPSAVLINIGRGALVDEDAMIRALQEARLAGAALDVFRTEPPPQDSPLWGMPNVIISPHSASTVTQENARITELFCENLRRYLAGQPLRNVLDTEKLY